jgi:hypothetical protein
LIFDVELKDVKWFKWVRIKKRNRF